MYYAKVNWFDSFEEKDTISCMLIPAKDWNDAMQKISNTFEQINSIEMQELMSGGSEIVFLPELDEGIITKIIEENMC